MTSLLRLREGEDRRISAAMMASQAWRPDAHQSYRSFSIIDFSLEFSPTFYYTYLHTKMYVIDFINIAFKKDIACYIRFKST